MIAKLKTVATVERERERERESYTLEAENSGSIASFLHQLYSFKINNRFNFDFK